MAEESSSGPPFMLYNTMTKQKEIFKTKVPNKVGMYVCGVTAYDYSHIGHARAYVTFDVLYRYLKELGYEVTYVRNFTDVDDKIIRRAKEHKEKDPNHPLSDPLSLSNHYCEEFLRDMDDLQCLLPTHQPRVSDHTDQIRDMIATIIEKGYAYPLDGDVYFSVDKLPSYGQLSKRKLEDNKAGERVSVDSRKRHPADFALWKSAKPDEPSWDSPWGPGRPGWHIECSAMSAHYLTFSFDIHGGGMDLIFPHHENELAQSCAACSETHISYWVHNGFVTVNEEKMSKSTGNFFTIREVTKEYHPLALRYFLLSMHYSSPVNYSLSELDIASDSVFHIYQTLQDFRDALLPFQGKNLNDKAKPNSKKAIKSSDNPDMVQKMKEQIEIKMSDDLHSPDVLKGTLDALLPFQGENLNEKAKPNSKKSIKSSENPEDMVQKMEEQFEIQMSDDLHSPDVLKGTLDALLPFQGENLNGKAKPNSKKAIKSSRRTKKTAIKSSDTPEDIVRKMKTEFEKNMSDDLHTPDVLNGALQVPLKFINIQLDKLKNKEEEEQMLAVQSLIQVEDAVRKVLDVLGLLSALPYLEVLEQLKEKALIRAKITEDDVSRLIEERAEARKKKDFSKSDEIRRELTAKGISLMDLPTGTTTWRPCVPEGNDHPPPPTQ